MINNKLSLSVPYAAPNLKLITARPSKLVCASKFGNEGYAGSDITSDDIQNYGEDF